MTFDDFYSAYPRKVARKDAEKAWGRLSDEDKAAAVAALPNHIAAWNARGDSQFIPYAATWLNGARWEDEVQIPAPPKQSVEWWRSDTTTLAKGREVGVLPRPGEEMPQYRERVATAIRSKAA